MPVGAVIGAAVVGAGSTALASSASSKASGRATEAQTQSQREAIAAQTASQEQAIAEQRRQYDATRELLQPFVAAGSPALQAQLSILGLSGPEQQRAAIAQQEQSPFFQALAQQGEEALLQKASATGGLRGGNIQGALAQFRPSLGKVFAENPTLRPRVGVFRVPVVALRPSVVTDTEDEIVFELHRRHLEHSLSLRSQETYDQELTASRLCVIMTLSRSERKVEQP